MCWIRLLPGSGSKTQQIQSWIRNRNKSFRIHNTGLYEYTGMSGFWTLGSCTCSNRDMFGLYAAIKIISVNSLCESEVQL